MIPMTAKEIAERIQDAIDRSPYADGMIGLKFQEHDWLVVVKALRDSAAFKPEQAK